MEDKIFWGYHTHFSMGDSIIEPEDGVKRIKEMGYEKVALADVMSVSALVSVAKACKKHGLGFIAGCTVRVQSPYDPAKYWYPKVYFKQESALVRYMGLLSTAPKEYERLYLPWEAFRDSLADDLLVTTGSALGVFSHLFTDAQRDAMLAEFRTRCSSNGLVLELAAVASPPHAVANMLALQCADRCEERIIVAPNAFYLNYGDHDARDVMQGILARRKINMGTMRFMQPHDRFIKPVSDMHKDLYASMELATKILGVSTAHGVVYNPTPHFTYEWVKKSPSLPKLAADENVKLREECKKRFEDRICRPVFGYQPDKSIIPEYVERLKYELGVIEKMGFAGYFLLVADLVQWSKDNGIIVGPGRGSVGGSLIAFIMGITEVDPLRFNLLFERFINPGRQDLPDADLDFMSERRHEIIQYLRDKYGVDNVGGIANYNTLSGASAIRDVGKALLLEEKDYECSKMVPKEHGIPVDLKVAVKTVGEIEAYSLKHPEAFTISCQLEGVLRAMGTHAAGVVVSSKPLTESAVVTGKGNPEQCINWDKRVSEEQGLVKIDILGLSTLDVIEKAFRKIERDYGKVIDILSIPMDDEKTLEAFGRGDTIGVFQFESSGMRNLLKNLRKGGPLTFEELSAATALFRPGPLDSGMLDDYVAIRQGIHEPHYDHDHMRDALSPTYGVCVYQEQVMQLARDVAGFSLQEADDLRKAMGKKDKDKMAESRDKWVDGCIAHSSMSKEVAGALFDKIEAFAGYGFNRSHSVEYSIISFVAMWLKVYYPLQFYAASLEIFKEDKLMGIVEDAAKRGIKILPPDINESDDTFKRYKGTDNLTAPFNRLKGLSDITQAAILAARSTGGPFKSKADFLARVEKRKCNIKHQSVLDKVGAFASIEPGTPPNTSPTRTRDQLELMPGLVSTRVNIGRDVEWDEFAKKQIATFVIGPAQAISSVAVNPRSSKKIKAMVITDAVTKAEEKTGACMNGQTADYVKNAIEDAGGKWNHGYYYTALCKAPKKDKRLTTEEMRQWGPILRKEIDLLKPPIIVALGTEIARFLLPDLKGPITELAGKVYYSKELDANIVVGINPGMIWVDSSKQDLLQTIFETAQDLM